MALAPERTGIGIRRYFTTPGLDPYDTVTWERRDARITNWATGAVAFEQLGVEVPSGWSVNATNILAQKYFRGTLGTPEREWSLKQVADRVAGTIVAWGGKDGYFADKEEADAFEAELKWLIIHQRAAFNSPVWFNIGVEGVPQQAAACFILSVNDSMDSILNWYVEEGRIFKGGSGAGINLSRIRSSKEGLRGGGTASGPVSFMRGADASAGTIKSGGKTRRAAKMIVLDADHPDIEDFIWCKAIEERKARALRDAGFDMDLDGKDSYSIQYQNANNSVRVTDEFMEAVLDDKDWELKAVSTGEVLKTMKARDLFRQIAKAAWECADPGMQFDTTINRWHTAKATGRINASNPCSEYLHLDNSACNLASLNLLKFLDGSGEFDVDGFKSAVEVVFTGQEILVGNADYPTKAIGETSRRFRQLGLGYANLGALLMAQGLPYDSDGGRAWAGAITALMTGHAYAVSARTAARMGPFAGYHENKKSMLEVLRMHRAEVAKIDEDMVPPELLSAAQEAWDTAVETADKYGVRNSQASVLAPTGCLVGGSLVATERGLVRLASLGDPEGEAWQDVALRVATGAKPELATKFFVNGLSSVVQVQTRRGHRVQGTPQHRVKVVDPTTGEWDWKRFADLKAGDVVPLALDQMVGEPQAVPLPPLPEAYWTAEHHGVVPRQMTAELAELVGYFMGDGSLHSGGLSFCVREADIDVVERLGALAKSIFGLEAATSAKQGCTEVRVDSVRVTLWWEACGFAKHSPSEAHGGKGYVAHIPNAVLAANDRAVYSAFLRGLYEAGGGTSAGYPTFKSTSLELAQDVQSVLLAMGYPTAFGVAERATARGKLPIATVRLLNGPWSERWLDEIGPIGGRKQSSVEFSSLQQPDGHDFIPLTRMMIDKLAPLDDRLRTALLLEHSRGKVTRRAATELYERTGDPELGHLLGFFYDRVSVAQLGDEELTYDLSVPQNVTYVANGFISHNTIGLMMDCDTTGVEPDLGLVKTKKLVGGGTMSIVNQTIPRALGRLGYNKDQVGDIVAYVDEHKSILGAPHIAPDHLAVFACSMGDNTIHYMGHLKMMAAAQPFISGAISKCVTGGTLIATSEGLVRIGSFHEGEKTGSFRDEVVEVASLNGTSKTDAFFYGGNQPTRKAVLRSGLKVTGTHNHRLLVAGKGGLEWARMDELNVGDYVAARYGTEMWGSIPPCFTGFEVPKADRRSKEVNIPSEMTEDLAFLLGAYASQGHTSPSTWTISITNFEQAVLDKVYRAIKSCFHVEPVLHEPEAGCKSVSVSSRTIVEFLEYLGCGQGAKSKRVPDVVLRSPRPMVLAFLQGLALEAYVASGPMTKWAIALDSPELLDDLQALTTNLGVLTGRVSKYDPTYDKAYDEVYASGPEALRMLELVPFLVPSKAAGAAKLSGRLHSQSTSDIVPGVVASELLALVPRAAWGTGRSRAKFPFLNDPRTGHVSRGSLERLAQIPGVELPVWLNDVLRLGIHFSPVESVEDSGVKEVFDLSVPVSHSFVGNGIVNHNTINTPEDVTVEDVEQLHIEAWRLGIKAVAMYRDNCKVAQPLATTKKAGAGTPAGASEPEVHDAELAQKVAELEKALQLQTVVVKKPVHEHMPRKRKSSTFSFRVADCEGYVTVGEFPDGRPGEVFISVSKQGSTLAGIMDAFAISVSMGLQHGVPLATFVRHFTNMRFEPAGMTDDPELRFASSLVDYIFRRLAVEYMGSRERMELGIQTVNERMQPTLPGVEEAVVVDQPLRPDPIGGVELESNPAVLAAPLVASTGAPARPAQGAGEEASGKRASDAPMCYTCGVTMQRAGSCFACPSCGSTSGCS